jgi:cytochrome c peroxidase
MNKWIPIALIFIGLALSCTDSTKSVSDAQVPSLPDQPFDYQNLRLPLGTSPSGSINRDFGFEPGGPVFTNQSLQITPQGATLGRVLFYDKKLSLNNTVSCGTCHHQEKAFADGLQFSQGFEGRTTPRNSMSIVNPVVQNNLFWDSRSQSLHDLSLQPVRDHIEMGMENMDRLVTKLKETEYYAPLFSEAYGSSDITAEKISKALSQFVSSITSNRSRFDMGLQNGFSNYTELEKLGHNLFHSDRLQCSSCHGGTNFSALDGPGQPYGGGGGSFGGEDLKGATNIGLDLIYKDQGVGNGRFKIPGLRNVELTGPYMHDGRFSTLEEVIEHYNSGVKPHAHLDPKFLDDNGHVKKLHLTSIEKKALVAFLKTLTDEEMVTDPRWSDPFRH